MSTAKTMPRVFYFPQAEVVSNAIGQQCAFAQEARHQDSGLVKRVSELVAGHFGGKKSCECCLTGCVQGIMRRVESGAAGSDGTPAAEPISITAELKAQCIAEVIQALNALDTTEARPESKQEVISKPEPEPESHSHGHGHSHGDQSHDHNRVSRERFPSFDSDDGHHTKFMPGDECVLL